MRKFVENCGDPVILHAKTAQTNTKTMEMLENRDAVFPLENYESSGSQNSLKLPMRRPAVISVMADSLAMSFMK